MQAVVEIQILVDFINAFTESDYRKALWLRAGVVFRVGLMLPSAISLHYQYNLPSKKHIYHWLTKCKPSTYLLIVLKTQNTFLGHNREAQHLVFQPLPLERRRRKSTLNTQSTYSAGLQILIQQNEAVSFTE